MTYKKVKNKQRYNLKLWYENQFKYWWNMYNGSVLISSVILVVGFSLGFATNHLFFKNDSVVVQPESVVKPTPVLQEKKPDPEAKRNPHNQLLPGEKCTMELAKRLNPEDFQRMSKNVAEDLMEAKTIKKAFRAKYKKILASAKMLPKIEPLSDLKNGLFPDGTENVTWEPSILSPDDRTKSGKKLCILWYGSRSVLEAPDSALPGDPRNYAQLALEYLNTTKPDTDDDNTYQYWFFSCFWYLNTSFACFSRPLRRDNIVRPILSKIVANPLSVQLLGPWVKNNILPRLNSKGKTNVAYRLKTLWRASNQEFAKLHRQETANPNDCKDEKGWICSSMTGMMYRRWLNAGAGRQGDRMIRIYRIWMAVYAAKLQMKEAKEWLTVAMKDVEGLGSDQRDFYRDQLDQVSNPQTP